MNCINLIESNQNLEAMGKEKSKAQPKVKKAPKKTLKEKRAIKKTKKAAKK
jgi:hypothetical protein